MMNAHIYRERMGVPISIAFGVESLSTESGRRVSAMAQAWEHDAVLLTLGCEDGPEVLFCNWDTLSPGG